MKKKLLFLTVVSLIFIMMPTLVSAGVGRTVNVSNITELTAAINDQQPGDTIIIANGTYDLPRNATVLAGGQTGWYFPIVADNVVIQGESRDGVLLMSSEFSPNGSWSSQDFIAIFGNNVTLENLTLQCKLEANKTIETMGLNVTIRNITIDNIPGDPYDGWSGSLYFNGSLNGGNVGNVLIQDVLIRDAFISAVPFESGHSWFVNAGTITLCNVTVEINGNMPTWNFGVISDNPTVFECGGPSCAGGGGFQVFINDKYDDASEVQSIILDMVPDGTEVIIPDGSYGGDLSVFSPAGNTTIRFYTVINPRTGDFNTAWLYITSTVLLLAITLILKKKVFN